MGFFVGVVALSKLKGTETRVATVPSTQSTQSSAPLTSTVEQNAESKTAQNQATTGDSAMQVALKELADANVDVRRKGIWTLLDAVGPQTTEAVEPLLKATEDSDPFVKTYALRSLGRINDPKVVPVLVDRLPTADRVYQYHAVSVLAKAGPAAKGAIPQLKVMATDSDIVFASASAKALKKIGGDEVKDLFQDPKINHALYGVDKISF